MRIMLYVAITFLVGGTRVALLARQGMSLTGPSVARVFLVAGIALSLEGLVVQWVWRPGTTRFPEVVLGAAMLSLALMFWFVDVASAPVQLMDKSAGSVVKRCLVAASDVPRSRQSARERLALIEQLAECDRKCRLEHENNVIQRQVAFTDRHHRPSFGA